MKGTEYNVEDEKRQSLDEKFPHQNKPHKYQRQMDFNRYNGPQLHGKRKNEPQPYEKTSPDHKRMERVTKAFDEAWDDLAKFADCPYCLGVPGKCPEGNTQLAKNCKIRRATLSHLARGRGQIRTIE